jgi:CRP/FNR family cyclic AMP-dependent transcriptional regulator
MKIADAVSIKLLAAIGKVRPFRRHRVKSGAVVYEACPTRKTYIVETGYVRLVFPEVTGRYRTKMLLGKGALLGELPFGLTTIQTEESAIANGTASILELDRTAVETAAHHDNGLRQAMLEAYASQLQLLDRRLQWQFISPLHRRIATILYDLMCFEGQPCGHGAGYLVDVRMTHEELSELVGAARSNVSTHLNDLRAQGIISYTRAYLCVRNMDMLRRRAE